MLNGFVGLAFPLVRTVKFNSDQNDITIFEAMNELFSSVFVPTVLLLRPELEG